MSVKSAETLFLETSEKALKGDVEAQNYLGYMYACGLGTKRDALLARQWYQKAIEKNHKTARTNLEDLEKYEDKKSLDVNSALIRKNSELHAINEELRKGYCLWRPE